MCSNCTNLPICNLPISSENQTQVTTFGKSSSDTIISSSRFLQGYRILRKIPKGSRILVAETLVETIDGVLNDSNNSLNWEKLFNFVKLILAVPRNPDSASESNLSLNSIIRSNIAVFRHSGSPTRHQLARPVKPFSCAFDEKTQLCKRVNAKLIEGDVSAAVRVVASEDISPTSEVMDALRLKHLPTPSDFRPPPPLFDEPPTTNPNEVLAALRSFPPSSSAGLDGLKPRHLKDLTSSITFEAGGKLLNSLSNICNILLSGNLPIYARELIFAANLTALHKKDGGIRPIAVGNVFRRLASKIISRRVVNDLSYELRPFQLGVGVRNGCEGAVYSIRDYISANQKSILIKLDIKNAFNAVSRDHLSKYVTTVPLLFTT